MEVIMNTVNRNKSRKVKVVKTKFSEENYWKGRKNRALHQLSRADNESDHDDFLLPEKRLNRWDIHRKANNEKEEALLRTKEWGEAKWSLVSDPPHLGAGWEAPKEQWVQEYRPESKLGWGQWVQEYRPASELGWDLDDLPMPTLERCPTADLPTLAEYPTIGNIQDYWTTDPLLQEYYDNGNFLSLMNLMREVLTPTTYDIYENGTWTTHTL